MVTEKFVENQLPNSLETFNRSRETDMLPFPINIEPEMRLTYTQKDKNLTIETIIPSNDMGNEAEIWEFIFVYKDGKWLMDKWSSHTPRDLKLTKEEASEFLKIEALRMSILLKRRTVVTKNIFLKKMLD